MRHRLILILLLGLVALMVLLNLTYGAVSIPAGEVTEILLHGESSKQSWTYIVLESRVPQALTACFCGASLATAGLLLQTAFQNPLAGPSILGITNGAGLGVGIVMLVTGGVVSIGGNIIVGYMAIVAGAMIGSMAVIALLLAFASIVRSATMLLIVGIMVGFIVSSLVMLLNFFATADNIQSYITWGMGSFSDVSMDAMPFFAITCTIGLLLSILLVKPLNALLLGEVYAINLGVNIRQTRLLLLITTGLLTAVCTAFCGPIAFIGLAVPHVARLLCDTSNHQVVLPTTMLSGAVIALVCNLVCTLPENSIIPLNAVTPIFGAPIILYIIVRKS